MRNVLLAVFVFCFTLPSLAQKKTDPKMNNVKSVTVSKQDFEKGAGPVLRESYVLYDANGNVLEEIEYNNDGKVKTHFKYQYDGNGNKIKEFELNPAGKTVKTTEYKYNGNMRTERNVYDASGKLKSKKTYQYEYIR